MSKHTPGPWVIDEGAEDREPGFYGAPGDPGGYHSISTSAWRITGFIGDANARLIASAPELLGALECEEALNMPTESGYAVLERHGWDRIELSASQFVLRMRRAAIAKATGEA